MPLMCLKATENWCFTAIKNNLRTSIMMSGVLVEPLSHIWVMGSLSVTKIILFPAQRSPHVQAAAMMAKASWKSTSFPSKVAGHSAWIHSYPYIAPKPIPEASVNRHMSVLRMERVSGMIEEEFQVGSHSHHQ